MVMVNRDKNTCSFEVKTVSGGSKLTYTNGRKKASIQSSSGKSLLSSLLGRKPICSVERSRSVPLLQ